MKGEINTIIKPLSFQYKQNPVYAKLVLLFSLLGVTIFLFSSRSVDYSDQLISQFEQTTVAVDDGSQTNILSKPEPEPEPELDLTTSNKVSETETLPAEIKVESGETETGNEKLVASDNGYAPSFSTELHDEADKHKNEAVPTLSTEPHNDETAPSISTEPHNGETAPSTSTEQNNKETVPSTSTEQTSGETAPSASTEQNGEIIPSTSIELSNNKSPSSTSNESYEDGKKQKCNLFKGAWVPNPSGPAYNNYTCPWMDGHQNCIRNGRPDSGYLYWRWKPNDCELPKFNPRKFLEFMRYKYFAFVGDSIARNHLQSLMCMLSQVDEPKEVYFNAETKTNVYIFPKYNFTIAQFWAPFLLKSVTVKDSDNDAEEIQLHMDKLDETWMGQYPNLDYVIFSSGQWYSKPTIYYENNKVHGCHYCPGKNLTDIPFDVVYRKAISSLLNLVTTSTNKPRVLLRTITPSHFEGGDWRDGGGCLRKEPFKENEVTFSYVEKIMYDIQVQEFEAVVGKASSNGVDLKLFDTTGLSLLRPDGHPDKYRYYPQPAQGDNTTVPSDCLHWCLPGPIDSWNDLLMETLMSN